MALQVRRENMVMQHELNEDGLEQRARARTEAKLQL